MVFRHVAQGVIDTPATMPLFRRYCLRFDDVHITFISLLRRLHFFFRRAYDYAAARWLAAMMLCLAASYMMPLFFFSLPLPPAAADAMLPSAADAYLRRMPTIFHA